MTIVIRTYKNKAITPFLSLLSAWVVTHYIEFPFLYVSQGEEPPNHILVQDSNAFVLFAERGEKKEGLLCGIPLDSPFLDVK